MDLDRYGSPRRMRRSSAMFPPRGKLLEDLLVNLLEEVAEFFFRSHRRIVPALEGIESFLRRRAQPFDLGPVFLFALLQQP